MRQVVVLSYSCLGLAVLMLVLGFFGRGYWPLSLVILALLTFWVLGFRWSWGWAITSCMVGFNLTVAVGFWMDIEYVWLVFSMILLLAAWDLQCFAWRLGAAERIKGEKELINSHIKRLLIIMGVGLLLVGTALWMQVRISFGIAVFLGLLVILAMRQLISIAMQSND